MCFSPQADFIGGAVIAGLGVVTLTQVRHRRDLIVGTLPLMFGLHQLDEGLVWLGFQGHVSSSLADVAKMIYIVFAHVVLPTLVPLGLLLLEPDRRRARWMLPLVALGVLLSGYLLWEITAFPVGAQEEAHCVDYTTHTPNDISIGLVYVIVTCGAALISSRAYLRWFGLIAVIGAIGVAIVRVDELTSLWCAYVALISVLILEHFHRLRADTRGLASTTLLNDGA